MDDNKLLWDRFCRLGEMIGDGLHYEEPWISKEYKQLMKILVPETQEIEKERHKLRNENINKQMVEKLKKDKCKCGGTLKQVRSGSKTVICTITACSKKYVYKAKKK